MLALTTSNSGEKTKQKVETETEKEAEAKANIWDNDDEGRNKRRGSMIGGKGDYGETVETE